MDKSQEASAPPNPGFEAPPPPYPGNVPENQYPGGFQQQLPPGPPPGMQVNISVMCSNIYTLES